MGCSTSPFKGLEFLTALLPEYAAFDLPFLFRNFAAAFRFMDGPMGFAFFSELDPKGIVGMALGVSGLRGTRRRRPSLSSP